MTAAPFNNETVKLFCSALIDICKHSFDYLSWTAVIVSPLRREPKCQTLYVIFLDEGAIARHIAHKNPFSTWKAARQ